MSTEKLVKILKKYHIALKYTVYTYRDITIHALIAYEPFAGRPIQVAEFLGAEGRTEALTFVRANGLKVVGHHA